jgi:hypothetical protein
MPHAWWLAKNSGFDITSPGGVGRTYNLDNINKGIFLEWIGGDLMHITLFKGWTGKITPAGIKLFDDIDVFRSKYPSAQMGHSLALGDEIWKTVIDYVDYEGREHTSANGGAGLVAQLDSNKKIKYLGISMYADIDSRDGGVLCEQELERLFYK